MKYRVCDLVEKIRSDLEGEYADISLEGEVSNLTYSSSGHWYFNLSDAIASIKCAIFKMDALRLPLLKQLKNGDKIEAWGKIGVYVKRGEFQLIARKIANAGQGDLLKRLEQLKARLAQEGLFDAIHKKKIPVLPRRVAVITAEKAAALQDFLNIYQRRALWMDIILSPALVQGETAPQSIIQALHRLIAYDQQQPSEKKIDLIVITRGGGSIEDLWAFNDEALAYELFHSPIPIVSAVGHEVDYTICDYVADLRCETPSAAAEVLTEGMVQLKRRLQHMQKSLSHFGDITILQMKNKVSKVSPRHFISLLKIRQHEHAKKLTAIDASLTSARFFRLPERYQNLDHCHERMFANLQTRLHHWTSKLESLNSLLVALDPNSILKRGYSLVYSSEGKLVDETKVFDQNASDLFEIHFHDGARLVRRGSSEV